MAAVRYGYRNYVGGSFAFTPVKSDKNNISTIDPGKTIRLKRLTNPIQFIKQPGATTGYAY